MRRFDLALVGHVTHDLDADGGWYPGGTVSYAARVAADLGLRVSVVTAARSLDGFERVFRGVEVFCVPSTRTTSFRNVYRGGSRQQLMPERARAIGIADLPREARQARAVLLGPVASELPWTMTRAFSDSTLISACLQGWLRAVDPADRRVYPRSAQSVRGPSLAGLSAVFLSREDLGDSVSEGDVMPWLRRVDNLLITDGDRGATILSGGSRATVPAHPASASDPTGAGDTFAAGFMARYLEARDAPDSALYASAAASIMVEQQGIGRLEPAEVERRYRVLREQLG